MAKLPDLSEILSRLGLGKVAARASARPNVASGVRAQFRREDEREDLDRKQRMADIAGVVDPTGVVDAGNAITYVMRALKEPERRGQHLKDAAISALGVIPYIGDLAKVPRLIRGAKAGSASGRAARAAARGGSAAQPPRAPVSRGGILASLASLAGGQARPQPSSDRPVQFEQRARSANDAAQDAAASRARGGGSPPPQIPMHAVLGQGSNFGDIMGGQKTVEQARTEMEGEQKEAEAKEVLIRRIKQATGAFATLTLGTVALTKSVHAVGAAMIARQRELGNLDPTIAFAAGRLDIGRIHRQVERGQLTGTSFRELSDAINHMEKELAPYQAAAVNIGNRIVEMLARGVTYAITIAEAIPGVEAAVDKVNETLSKREREGMAPYVQLLDDLRAGRLSKPKAPRKL